MVRRRSNKHSKIDKYLKILIIFGVIIVLVLAGSFYTVVYKPNISIETGDKQIIHIPSEAQFNYVVHLLEEKGLIHNTATFRWLSQQMNYKGNVLPGRYKLKDDMSNVALIRLLRSGQQAPLRLTFLHARYKTEVAGIFCNKLEADSARFIKLLNDKYFLRQFGVTPQNVLTLFIPNTYEFYWNTSSKEVIARMHEEFTRFWNDKRLRQAKALDLTPHEVIILASIVEEETYHDSEESKIAGVYVNRLQKNWKLQADPTLKFAIHDFTLDRVLNKHKKVESPYNTYKHKGLPPGPICLPQRQTIDATLQAQDHEYMYFCAKEDFSGYHYFSKTYAQHLKYARRLQRKLNAKNIK